MILNPIFFTYENLSSLKFKELQKLSKQLCVNRRWAKKQDLINNLLALKDKEASNNDRTITIKQDEEKEEWKDGCFVFNDLGNNTFSEEGLNKRLTYNITCKSAVDPRLTFEVPQNGKNFSDINDQNVDSRQTYDIPPNGAHINVQPVIDVMAVFDVSPREKPPTEENDPRATFNIVRNKNELLGANEDEFWENSKTGNICKENVIAKAKDSVETSNMKENFKKIPFGLFEKEKPISENLHVKVLTIPHMGATRRMRKSGETIKNNNSLKMSKKSINIKKSSRQIAKKPALIESPALLPLNKSVNEEAILQPLTKCKAGKKMQSKIPAKLHFRKEKLIKKEEMSSFNNADVRKNLRMQSKPADEDLVKKPSLVKVSLMTPPVALTKNPTVCASLKKTKGDVEIKPKSGKIDSQTPSGSVVATKPLTAVKMPDFKKIHQKQFEQMDSLHEYIRKKEERTKRLFGTPQPALQPKGAVKAMPFFRFQSTVCEKSDVKFDETKLRNSNKALTFNRENNAKYARKEAFKNKLPPTKSQIEIKDKNRSRILGVRTNKRFELQMKFRNM